MNNTNPNRFIFSVLRYWIPLAFTFTIVCGLIYIVMQQNYRQNANDPEVQMAQDTAAALAAGTDSSHFINTDKVNMGTSLAPFIVIYDSEGKVVSSNGLLDGHVPLPPSGVFDYARQHGEDRFTWQPRLDVRNATVVVYYNGATSGFVLATRSLKEAEDRTQQLGVIVMVTWLAGCLGSLVLVAGLDSAKTYLGRLT